MKREKAVFVEHSSYIDDFYSRNDYKMTPTKGTGPAAQGEKNTEASDASTSEVGFDTPNSELSQILEQQNRNFMELLRTMQANAAPREPKRVFLPKYNPEAAGADPCAWSITADMIFIENPLEGSVLVIALSKALEGSASQWLS